MTPVQQLAACERTFRRHGLSLLVHGHSSRCDVFGRAAPFLLVMIGLCVALMMDLATDPLITGGRRTGSRAVRRTVRTRV